MEQYKFNIERNELINLVARAKENDNEAWTRLINETYQPALFTVRSYLGNERQTEEDVLQETYIKAFKNIASLQKPESFKSWICSIAAKTALDYLRKRGRMLKHENVSDTFEGAMEPVEQDIDIIPDESLDMTETITLLNEMLSKLSRNQQIALALHYGDGFSASEIGKLMGCPTNTAKSYLDRGIGKLRLQKNEMEKKGIKLRSFALIPMLRMFYTVKISEVSFDASSAATIANTMSANTIAGIEATSLHPAVIDSPTAPAANVVAEQAPGLAGGTASTVSTAATVTATAAGTAGKLVMSKFLIGAGIVAAIGGGSLVGYQALHNAPSPATTAMTTFPDYTGSPVLPEKNEKMDEEMEFGELFEQANALEELNLKAPKDQEKLDNFLKSDTAKAYREANGTEIIWIPSDTGESVTGYYPNGGIYQGAAESGIRTGNGTWKYKDCTFTGKWTNDMPNGQGELECEAAHFIGQFVEGEPDGTILYNSKDVSVDIQMDHGTPIPASYPESFPKSSKYTEGTICLYAIISEDGHKMKCRYVPADYHIEVEGAKGY